MGRSGPYRLLVTLLLVLSQSPARTTAPRARQFNVLAYGAAGDGRTDDAGAIQKAIDAAERAGGGIVYFPRRTYLLNSTRPASHPWAFYNLIVGSNVTLSGQPGARLLQGPGGRHAVVEGATEVRNTMVAFGRDYTVIRFQNAAYNGGFLALRPTRAGDPLVTLARAADASRFRTGDFVAIYAQTVGDVIPTETGRVAGVDADTGRIRLREPLSRSFSAPSMANVTRVATTSVGIRNLIVQGSEPLSVTETFGFTAENNRFINDTSVGGGNVVDFNMNTLNGFRFAGNVFTSIGPGWAVVELPQRNSRNGVFDGNTFAVRQMGFGEYAAHIRFTNNTITLHPDRNTVAGLALGGLDVLFSRNRVSGGNLTGGEGFGALIADYLGPGDYASYVGRIRIEGNRIACRADGNACLGIYASDTTVVDNDITVHGSGVGLHAEGPLPQSLLIERNRFTMETGSAVVLATSGRDGATIRRNTITGAPSSTGIHVASPGLPGSGGHVIADNRISGCRVHVEIDMAKHPGSRVRGN